MARPTPRTLRLALLIAALTLLAVSACKRPPPEVTTKYVYAVEPAGGAAGAAAVAGSPNSLPIAGSPIKGPAVAKVVIVESSEFQ